MVRGVLITPGEVLPRETSYLLVFWMAMDRTFPYTNTLSDLGVLRASYWSRQNVSAASAGSCGPLRTLFLVAACVLAVELTVKMAFTTLQSSFTARGHTLHRLFCCSPQTQLLSWSVLYGRLLREHDSAEIRGGDTRVSVPATTAVFVWVSGTVSAISFLTKVVPREWILRALKRHVFSVREVHVLTVTVRPLCCCSVYG